MSGDVAFAKEVAHEATRSVGVGEWLKLTKRQQSHLQDVAIERVGKRNGYGETVAAIGTYRTSVGMYRRKSGPGADFARMRAENPMAARGQDTFLAIGREIGALERQYKAMNAEPVAKPVEVAKVPVAIENTPAHKLEGNWRNEQYTVSEPKERSVAEIYRDFVTENGYAPSDKIVAGLLGVDPSYAAQIRRRMEKDGWRFEKATRELRVWNATQPPTIEEKREQAKATVAQLLDGADEAIIKRVLAALMG